MSYVNDMGAGWMIDFSYRFSFTSTFSISRIRTTRRTTDGGGKNIPTQLKVYRFISNISVSVDQIATINSIYWPKATKLSVFCCFSVYLPTRTLSMLSVSEFSRAFQSISGYLKALQAIENHIWTFQSISKHSKDTSTSLIGKDKIPAKSQSIANNRRNNSTGRLFVLNEMNEAGT